jgi:ABC-type glycerol-3-phosphate transport system permease component
MSINVGSTAPAAATTPREVIPVPATGGPQAPLRRPLSRSFAYLATWAICFLSLFPLYWMFENSLRPGSDAENSVRIWPEAFEWSNYSKMWNALAYPFHVFLINSFVMAGLVTLGTVVSCALVAYGFARFKFPGRELLFGIIISTMMIPYAVMMIPQYALFVNLFHWGGGGQIGSYQNLNQFYTQIVPAFFGSPVFIFLLRQFIRGIPYDLDEAAKVDGAGPLRILWSIILPELRPALSAVVVLTFIGKWNDFLGPLIYLTDPHNWTIELALNGFVGRYGTTVFNLQMAAALMSLLPIVIIYFVASRQIIEGVTLSGVKG